MPSPPKCKYGANSDKTGSMYQLYIYKGNRRCETYIKTCTCTMTQLAAVHGQTKKYWTWLFSLLLFTLHCDVIHKQRKQKSFWIPFDDWTDYIMLENSSTVWRDVIIYW